MAARFLADKSPKVRTFFQENFPEWLQPAPSRDIPGDVVLNAAPMMVGADQLPRSSTPPIPKAAAAGESAASGLAMRVGRHLPYVGKAIRLGELLGDAADAITGKPEPPPAAPAPSVPAWWGKSNVGPPEQWGVPGAAAPKPFEPPPPAVEGAVSTVPRTLSGEGVLNQALTSLDNKTLLQVAKLRGLNVTAEAQLKPGMADTRIIKKIIDDFSPDELENVRSTGLEISRHGPAPNKFATPKLAADAWHLKVLQTFFPDVKLNAAALKRVQAAQSRIDMGASGSQYVEARSKGD